MKISLFDYDSIRHEVEIPDDTQEISDIILSGDMVMLKPFMYDTGNNRTTDFLDDTFTIKRNQFENTNHCNCLFECLSLQYDETV